MSGDGLSACILSLYLIHTCICLHYTPLYVYINILCMHTFCTEKPDRLAYLSHASNVHTPSVRTHNKQRKQDQLVNQLHIYFMYLTYPYLFFFGYL